MTANTEQVMTYYKLAYRCESCGDEWTRTHSIPDTANCVCGQVDIEPKCAEKITAKLDL
jgi:hypothetical protein